MTLAVAVPEDEDAGVAVYALTSAKRRLDAAAEVEDFRTT